MSRFRCTSCSRQFDENILDKFCSECGVGLLVPEGWDGYLGSESNYAYTSRDAKKGADSYLYKTEAAIVPDVVKSNSPYCKHGSIAGGCRSCQVPPGHPDKCPKCNSWAARKSNRYGSYFTGCTNYPKCDWIFRNSDDTRKLTEAKQKKDNEAYAANKLASTNYSRTREIVQAAKLKQAAASAAAQKKLVSDLMQARSNFSGTASTFRGDSVFYPAEPDPVFTSGDSISSRKAKPKAKPPNDIQQRISNLDFDDEGDE